MATIAIIETGGKQYVVTEDTVLSVESIAAPIGGTVVFDKVLLVDDGTRAHIGKPYIPGAQVTGELIAAGKGKKISVIRYRPKSRYFKKRGHRQLFSKVRITALPRLTT